MMAFAAASAGAILSLPLAPPVKDNGPGGGAGGGGLPGKKTDGESKDHPSLVREQEQLEAWTAATVGLPVESVDNGVDQTNYYIQVSPGDSYLA